MRDATASRQSGYVTQTERWCGGVTSDLLDGVSSRCDAVWSDIKLMHRGTDGGDDNRSMPDEPVPPIELAPPYSMEFVAHLHAGCYAEGISRQLIRAVRQDKEGQRMLDALSITQLELRIWS